ncbi:MULTISPECIES: Ig-like domain-containing protein [Enterococcus]|uniref:Ig-like domain-containing protein n=1 Tax=Enterococcus TaxID=1350 RepID=UPI0022FD38F0|nr:MULTISPECIES: Ig-like domain-containing protein [Enterococcus]MDO0919129.1 Ig-like domain-containing protein [Enterococcus sp. B1E2]WBY93355.1 Ig-like domain-containing protein [Enterococcus casseliflavus]WIV16738.1 Ig-like domain-containing protein [Enterococcus sp. FZMF]
MIKHLGKAFAVLLLLIPVFAGMRVVYGETDVGAKLITNVSIVNSHNEVITSIEKDDSFKIDMTWSLEDLGDLKAGDKATVTLPAEIEGVNNTYALYDENNNLVVNVIQVGNQLTFVFTEFVEQNTNVHGDFYFWTKFSDDVIENQINNINFETANGTQSVPIFIQAVDDSGEGALLTKQGLYLGTQEPKRIIDWRVYINTFDTDQVTIKDGTFIDFLGPHQTLVSTSARVVYGPSVSNPTYVEQVPIVLNSDGSFEIPLRDTEERIYITYKTETDGSLEQYTNRGILDALVNDVPRTSSITGYTPRYGGGGGGTGEPGESSSTEPSSESSTSSSTEPSSESSTSSSTEPSSESSMISSSESNNGSSSSNNGAITHQSSTPGNMQVSQSNNLHNQSEKQQFPQTNESSNHLWIAIGMVLAGCALKLSWSKFIR